MSITKKISVRWKELRILVGAIICTIIWLGLFPVLLFGAMMGGMVFDPHIPTWIGAIIIFLAFLLPLSSPVTIVCIWICFFYKKPSFMYCSNFIPIVTMIILGVVIPLLLDIVRMLR